MEEVVQGIMHRSLCGEYRVQLSRATLQESSAEVLVAKTATVYYAVLSALGRMY